VVKILGILRLQSRNRHTSTTEIHLHKRSLNQWLCGQDIFCMCLFRILILVGLSWCKYLHVQYLFVKTFVIGAKTDWSSTIKIQLNMLVSYKVDLIIISFKINLFSAWYGWKIDGLVLNNNHSHKFCMEFSCDKYDKIFSGLWSIYFLLDKTHISHFSWALGLHQPELF
jgi:hypothetical protein